MYKIVTICGSMKYKDIMLKKSLELQLKNKYVVLQPVYGLDNYNYSDEDKKILGELHFKRIDISDAIYVVNIDGYIGESTKKKIQTGNVIGEKGIGFKSVFEVAEKVTIHSNGFDFILTSDKPTVPNKCTPMNEISGTVMRFTMKDPNYELPNSDKILQLCLCLKKLRHIEIGDTIIDINDVEDLFFAYDRYNSIEEKIADNFEYICSEFCNDDGKDLMIGLFNKIAKDIGIIKYIAPLTMNEKLVVFLYYLATLNGSEIGRKMNKSRQCVNESMRNAIKKIKKEISKNEKI